MGAGLQRLSAGMTTMWYGNPRPREQRAAHEKAWKRADLVHGEEKWRQLSPAARLAFVTETKSPVRKGSRPTYTVRPARFAPEALEELRAAGFVEVVPPGTWTRQPSVVVPEALWEFAHYVRSLYRF